MDCLWQRADHVRKIMNLAALQKTMMNPFLTAVAHQLAYPNYIKDIKMKVITIFRLSCAQCAMEELMQPCEACPNYNYYKAKSEG